MELTFSYLWFFYLDILKIYFKTHILTSFENERKICLALPCRFGLLVSNLSCFSLITEVYLST